MKYVKLTVVSLLMIFILSGCSRDVENEEINVNFGDKTINGNYTGTLIDDMATGEGKFIASEEDGGWEYVGMFDNNAISGEGTISNFSYDFDINDNIISAMYEGQCLNGIPNGEGIAKGKIAESDFEYSGIFDAGKIGGNGEVINYPYTLSYDGENILGLYSGSLTDNLPSSEGTFNSIMTDIQFDYQGMWEKGKLSGEGTLSTNHYTIEFSTVVRTGHFEGSVNDGRASGEGVFTAQNDKGDEYTYTGMFENGTYNGYGEKIFVNNEDYPVYKGTYTNGEFTPTKSEFLAYAGTMSFISFEVSEENLKFIDEHEELFLTDDKSLLKELHHNEITMNELYKKPKKYSEVIVSVSKCKVIQIMEEEVFGNTITWFLCNDSNYNTVFVLANGELPNVNKNSRIRVYGLPIGFASYENTMGANSSAYVIYASYIE